MKIKKIKLFVETGYYGFLSIAIDRIGEEKLIKLIKSGVWKG